MNRFHHKSWYFLETDKNCYRHQGFISSGSKSSLIFVPRLTNPWYFLLSHWIYNAHACVWTSHPTSASYFPWAISYLSQNLPRLLMLPWQNQVTIDNVEPSADHRWMWQPKIKIKLSLTLPIYAVQSRL